MEHEHTWAEDECEIHEAIQANNRAAFKDIYDYYKVTRTLNANPTIRSQLLDEVYAVRLKGTNGKERLKSFAKNVERIACTIGELQPNNGRPISAVSKLLVHLHPTDGFIYDTNARKTVNRILGTPTKIDGLEKFQAFAQDYLNLFCQLKAHLETHLNGQKGTLFPTLIVDKFLWLQGTKNPSTKVRRLIRNASRSHTKQASEITRWLNEHSN